jgi:hypothetical protein
MSITWRGVISFPFVYVLRVVCILFCLYFIVVIIQIVVFLKKKPYCIIKLLFYLIWCFILTCHIFPSLNNYVTFFNMSCLLLIVYLLLVGVAKFPHMLASIHSLSILLCTWSHACFLAPIDYFRWYLHLILPLYVSIDYIIRSLDKSLILWKKIENAICWCSLLISHQC